MDNPVCPETGAPLHRGTRPLILTYKGESLTVDMPGWYRDGSDEGIHAGDDMKVSDRALNRLKARVERLPAPEDIRRVRRRLGLTQMQAGTLIGGGPHAFQKYESGDLLPSRAIASALAMLNHDPRMLTVLVSSSYSRDTGAELARDGRALVSQRTEARKSRNNRAGLARQAR